MRDALYLAFRYLAYHKVKTAILVTSITLIVFLPVGLRVLVSQSEEQLTARAAATPLLVGAKGSPLELALNSLYFEGGHRITRSSARRSSTSTSAGCTSHQGPALPRSVTVCSVLV